MCALAETLAVPAAQLLSDETLERVNREDRPAAREAAERIAANLEALLLAEAGRTPVDVSRGARAKPSCTGAQVLAGCREARVARAGVRAQKGRTARSLAPHPAEVRRTWEDGQRLAKSPA